MKWLDLLSENVDDIEDDSGFDNEENRDNNRKQKAGKDIVRRFVSENLEDGDQGGCWYFDPTQQALNPSELVLDENVLKLRRENVEMGDVLVNHVKKLLVMKLGSFAGEPYTIEPFCHVLLSVPFIVFGQIVDLFLTAYEGKKVDLDNDVKKRLDAMKLGAGQWCSIFHAILQMGVYLRHDGAWHNLIPSCKKLDVLGRSVNNDEINQGFGASIYQIIIKIGEWFEDRHEFRAAIWCYKHNLRSVKDPEATFPSNMRKECLVSQLSYIGLANKRMDYFVAACRYYEEAMIACSAHISAFDTPAKKDKLMKGLICNAKMMQSETKEWFGTSGDITSWGAPAVTETACATCGVERATEKCSACRLVRYCNRDCQGVHWKKAHKYTCLGKLRRK